uniref:Rpl20 n=1 Tax=Arundo donax TaxID=35708 RepID=A0A0A8Z8J6_ARUDO
MNAFLFVVSELYILAELWSLNQINLNE